MHEHQVTNRRTTGSDEPKRWTPGLQGRIVAVLLLAALVPLVIVGAGSSIVGRRLIEDRCLEIQRRTVDAHAASIELFLDERLRAIEIVARSRTLEEQSDPRGLANILGDLNAAYGDTFVDLGVVSARGEHLAYVGPYDLADRNYAQTEWYRLVMSEGVYVSDVFMGFREVPHLVLAVRTHRDGRTWILRTTIDSARFESIVRPGMLGDTGDAFIVNDEGVFQTQPRRGRVLGLSPVGEPERHAGVRVSRERHGGRTLLQSTRWINGGRWMLVVRQDEAEILAPVHAAAGRLGLVVALAVVLLVVTTVVATRHLTRRIDKEKRRSTSLSRDLLRSAKLASLGELATGLAHEINNPLAIMSAELTNISDLVGDMCPPSREGQEVLDSVSRCERQVNRCGAITAKMLQFGREGESSLRPSRLEPRLREIVDLMRKQARLDGIELGLEVEPDLPDVLVDATELEQVLVNLLRNACQAIAGAGRVDVLARRTPRSVVVEVIDTGSGIDPEIIDRIFQPFFTTKPVGRGTGLGLSVCYGIVRSWGGRLEAASVPGEGTTMTINLPLSAASTGGTRHEQDDAGCEAALR